jgi:MSHA biogenesis protein MshE
MARPEKIRLGEILLQQKLMSEEQLQFALAEQKRTGRKLGRLFVENGFVTEDQISDALARQLNVQYIQLRQYNIKPNAVRLLPEIQARRFRAIVLDDKEPAVLVGMADPTDLFAYDEISRILKKDIVLAVVNETELLATIDNVYRRTEEITGLARELEQELGEVNVEFGSAGIAPGTEDAPVVKLLQSVFDDATQVRASDVHIEPQEKRLQIRFRIDGVLHLQTEVDVRHGYFRKAHTARRALRDQGQAAANRRAYLYHANPAWRIHRHAFVESKRWHVKSGQDRHAAPSPGALPLDYPAPEWSGAGDRPDR